MKVLGVVIGSIVLAILLVASVILILAAAGYVNLYRVPKDLVEETRSIRRYERREPEEIERYVTPRLAPNVYEVPFSLPQIVLKPSTQPVEIPVNVPNITFKQVPQNVPVEISIPVFEPKIVAKPVEVPVVVPSIILKGVKVEPPIIKEKDDPMRYEYAK